MGLFDSLAGSLTSLVGSGGAHAGLAGEALNLLGGGAGGGLPGLVRSFESQGLGNVMQSWISTGGNLPVSAEQIVNVLGGGQVSQLAAKSGLSSDQVAGQLTQLLPQIVNALTPHGSLPASDALQEGLSLLRSKLG